MNAPTQQQPVRRIHRTIVMVLLVLIVLVAACEGSAVSPVPITAENSADLERIGDITITSHFAAVWPNGGQGIAVIDAERVHVYDLTTLTEEILPVEQPRTLAFKPSGDELAIGAIDGELSLWGITGEQHATLAGHTDDVAAIAFSKNTRTLATLDVSKQLYLWDLEKSRPETIIDLSAWPTSSARIEGIRISHDGSKLAILSITDVPTLKLWDIRARKGLRTLKWAEPARPLYNYMFSPGWDILAWVAGGTVQLMDVSSGTVGPNLSHEDSLSEWRFSPDGGTFATRTAETISGHFTGVVKLWDPRSGIARHTLAHPDFVSAMAFSADWERIATASGFGEIHMWDVDGGHETALLYGHNDTVWTLAFSPDGETLASASGDGSVRLWDVNNGQTLATLIGPSKTLSDVRFSRYGDWLAAVADNGDITLWGVSKVK